MKKVNKVELNRMQIIFELAKYAHPDWYHNLLGWPTEALRGLLIYYEKGGESKHLFAVAVISLKLD